jgi:hypothetical protein
MDNSSRRSRGIYPCRPQTVKEPAEPVLAGAGHPEIQTRPLTFRTVLVWPGAGRRATLEEASVWLLEEHHKDLDFREALGEYAAPQLHPGR